MLLERDMIVTGKELAERGFKYLEWTFGSSRIYSNVNGQVAETYMMEVLGNDRFKVGFGYADKKAM